MNLFCTYLPDCYNLNALLAIHKNSISFPDTYKSYYIIGFNRLKNH